MSLALAASNARLEKEKKVKRNANQPPTTTTTLPIMPTDARPATLAARHRVRPASPAIIIIIRSGLFVALVFVVVVALAAAPTSKFLEAPQTATARRGSDQDLTSQRGVFEKQEEIEKIIPAAHSKGECRMIA